MGLSIVSVLIAIISLQIGASLAKDIFPILGPVGATSLRLFFASLILLAIFRPWRTPLSLAAKKQIIVFGVSLGFMNLCFYKALEYIPQGLTVAIEFTGPLVLACILSKKKMDFLWIALAAIGLVLILPIKNVDTALPPLGILFALAAGFFWALYIYFGKKVGTDLGTSAIALTMCCACLITLPLGLYSQGAHLFQKDHIPLAIGIALLSSVIPYSLELFALKKIPAKTFGVLLSLEPAVAVLSGFLFLSEKITLVQGLAILLISLASAGSTLGAKAKKTYDHA